jgi:localization factor PodJL
MRKTAAWNVMGVERSTQAMAEEAARRAGMSLANWLDEVVAEQAADQGVAAEDLTEDDRLDAIGERLDQLSRREANLPLAQRRRGRSRESDEPPSAEREIAEARLEAAMAKFDLRASRNEERTAKALESVAQWIERSEVERAKEAARRQVAERDALRRERAAVGSRDDFDERLAPPPRRTEPVASRPRLDLQDAVERIHRRRGELDARQGLGARAAAERPATRAEFEEARPAPAPSRVARLPSQPREDLAPAFASQPTSNVDLERLRDEIAGLNARLDQFGRERAAPAPPPPAPVAPPSDRRLTEAETEALRAELAAMRRALTELAPRNANVALEGAVVDLGQRLEAMRKAAINGEALRPLEDMLFQVMELLRRQGPQSTARNVENDLKLLGGRIEALTRAAVDPAIIDQIRRQTEDVRQMLAKAADGAPLAKLERQIEHLANRADRLGNHPTPQPEIERLLAQFAEMRAQIERAVSPAFLKTVEQRLENLSARIDDALKQPAPVFDPRPIEDLARRFDTLKSVVEKRAEAEPAGAKFEAALADIGRKLDRPLPAPALDARPIENLARRVDTLKTAFEKQAAVPPTNPKLEAALAEIGRKLDRPAPVPTLDIRPFEEIARRVEGLKSVVERQSTVPAATARLEASMAEIGQKLERLAASPSLDARPLENLSRRFESLRTAVERQGANPSDIAKLEAALAEINQKLERPAAAPTFDTRPIEDLSRRFESLRSAIERQGANAKLEAALVEISQKLERTAATATLDTRPIEDLSRRFETLRTAVERQAANPSSNAKLEAVLAEISRKLDWAVTPPTFDTRPIEDLSRRFESLRGILERLGANPAANAKLEAALAEISQRLERTAATPTLDTRPIEDLSQRFDELRTAVERQGSNAKLEAALAEISQKLERTAATPTLDTRPIEDLARRFETLRTAVERQAANPSSNAKLEAALAEISRKLEWAVTPPTLDTRPIEDLSRRFESLKSVVERQAAPIPSTAKLEAALIDIGQRLEQVAAAPALDTRPIEELSYRFDALKGAVERQAAAIPSAAKLEAGLADIGQKLEQVAAAPALDTWRIEELSHRFESLRDAVERQAAPTAAHPDFEAAIAELSRKLDQPSAAPAFDTRPLDELAQQVESLKFAVEQQAEAVGQGGKLEAAIADIGRKLDRPPQGLADQMAIKSTLQALSARVEDGFRKIGEAPPDSGASVGVLELELLDEIARGLEDMRASIGRQGDFSASALRIEAAIADLTNRMESASEPASDRAALNETLQLLLSRLRDWAPAPPPPSLADSAELLELTNRIDALHASLAGHSEIAPQLSSLSAELAEIRERMGAPPQPSDDTRALVGLVQDLSNKIDERDASASDLRALETLTREVLAKPTSVDTSSIEAMIEDLGHKIDASASAHLDLTPLVDWMNKIETRLEAVDSAPVELAIRELGERLEAREAVGRDASQVEHTAELIAQRLEPSLGLGADAELLLQHLAEIHERLDGLGGAAGSNAALEKSVADLAAEFENTRELLASVIEPAAQTGAIINDIADLKAEHVDAERRMSTRLTRVQEILEQLSERLRLIEEGQEAPVQPTSAPQQAPAPAASSFDLNEIPDRPHGASLRPAPPPAAPPQAARGGAEPNGFLLEPGAGAPRGTAKKPDEPPRSAVDVEAAPKSTDLQAHIAAARRAAMAEMNARREQGAPTADAAARGPSGSMAALKQAQGVVANRRVPFLIGATLLVAAATAAIYEIRGGRLPLIQKSEMAPTIEAPLAQAPATPEPAPAPAAVAAAPSVDYAPTGAVNPAKPADNAEKPPASGPRPPADLIAAIPEGQPDSLKAAAIAGDANAETEMGLRYVEGRAVARDPKTGARWLELAANQNATYAQYRLGALYERGVGVAKDSQLARAWYKKAAEGGNARAMHNLAVMDAEDAGAGKPDYAAAAASFRAAGELGVRDSQYNLGVLYGRGLGLPQDLGQSWLWFSLAAQLGDADASKKRDEVAAKMDAKQLAAGAKLLADFRLKTPSPAANEPPQPEPGWEKAPAPQAAKPAATPAPTGPAVKS